MERYFAYGSNMLPRQMKERCPSAEYVDIGKIQGFKLIFNRRGTHHPGAVASVELGDTAKDFVYGVLWDLSPEDIASLDEIENPRAYIRIAVPVSREQHGTEYAWMYIAYPDGSGLSADQDYLEEVIEGASEMGLPDEYQASLERWRVA